MIRWFDVSKLSVCAVVLAAAAALAPPARAQCTGLCWTPRGSYSFIEFTGLYTVPDHPCLIAWTGLSNGGLRVSTDCGQQFADMILTNVYDVTAKNSDVGYVAAGTQGVVKTINGGGTWFQANTGLPVNVNASSLALHVGFPDTVFVGLQGGGVYIGGPTGTEGQMNWTAMNQGLLDFSVRSLWRVRGGSYMLAGTNSGIWRRTSTTNSWSMALLGVIANQFVIDSADSNRCYAATEAGFYRSTNAGQIWIKITNGLPNVPMNDICRRNDNPNVFYLATRGMGVYESTDQGSSWHKFGPDLPGDNDARAVVAVANGLNPDQAQVFVGTRANGLFEATYSTPAEMASWGRLKDIYR